MAEQGYPGHQMPGSYPNQQQMWANFYGSGGGPPGSEPGPRYLPPHMGPMEPGAWWQQPGPGHPGPDLGPDRDPHPDPNLCRIEEVYMAGSCISGVENKAGAAIADIKFES